MTAGTPYLYACPNEEAERRGPARLLKTFSVCRRGSWSWDAQRLCLSACALRSFGVCFNCIDGGDQDAFYFCTVLKQGIVMIIPAFNQQLDPILRFGAFFQGDLKLGYKICFPVSKLGFPYICADARRGTLQLIDKRRMPFYVFAELNCIYREFNR